MKLSVAFTKSWQDAKNFLSKADTYVSKNAPAFQADVKEAGQVVVAVDPALAPAVTAFDAIEESAVGEAVAAIHDGSAAVNSTSGAMTVTYSAELSTVLKGLVSTLSGHPAVVAATAATPATAAAVPAKAPSIAH